MPERANKFLLFLTISLTVRLLYIFMFPDCHSFDLASWNQVGDVLLAGGNPYHLTPFLNWPPLWMQLIFLAKKVSLAMHWPFDEVIRGVLIMIESGLAALLYAAIARFSPAGKAGWLLTFGMALNPVAVFQVCQHCNFDVLVGFWILLAVYMLLRFQEGHEPRFWLFACFALGMGALTKTVPLSLAPLLLLSARKLRLAEQVLGTVLLLGPIVLGLSILYVLVPADIENNVLRYRSTPGSFGFTGLFHWSGATRLVEAWPRVFEIIYGLGWLALAVWLRFRDSLGRRQIISLATVLLVAIPALGPGYGLQYVYWFLPLFVLLHGFEKRRMRIGLLVLYGVAGVTYTIEYALNFQTYGAFWLDIVQTESTVKYGRLLASKTAETMVTLPLWMLYGIFVAAVCAETGRDMIRDFRGRERRD